MRTTITIAIFFSFNFAIFSENAKQEPTISIDRILDYQHTFQTSEKIRNEIEQNIYSNLNEITRKGLSNKKKKEARLKLFYLLSISISNFKNRMERPIREVYSRTHDKELFAMAARYLISGRYLKRQSYLTDLKNRFRIQSGHVLYPCFSKVGLSDRYESSISKPQIPIAELFLLDFPLLLVLLPEASHEPGSLYILNHTREPVVIDPGIKVLAYSFSDLPFCFSEGNTPMGLYFFDTIEKSSNPAIGNTEAIKTRLPFEINASTFSNNKFHRWNADLYRTLFPKSLQKEVKWNSEYFEAYIAGSLGRHFIYLHGSGLDAKHFRNQSFFPMTPTRGCMTVEQAEQKNEQQRLLDILKANSIETGYLLVMPETRVQVSPD